MKWLFVSCMAVFCAHAQENQSPESRIGEMAAACYARTASILAPTNLPFSQMYTGPFSIKENGIRSTENYMGKITYIFGQFGFSFDVTTGKRRSCSNPMLREYVRTNYVQKIPQLSVDQALEQARSYLKLFDVNVDKDMCLSRIDFDNVEYKSWLIYWNPCYNGYEYDPSPPFDQHISVWFNEKYGFLGYSELIFSPPPKQTVVKITQEEAVSKASKAVPLIQRSPYYLQARLPGFVVSGLHAAKLLIAAPNWLLDPKRAVWLRDKPPEETRLCWMVAFTSVYTGKTEPGELLVPPLFFVYIDAATGEIVGANFT